eukprot:jgi/Botrbrau1/16299/Bobra.0066s0068.1
MGLFSSLIDGVSSSLCFRPPSPPTYEVRSQPQTGQLELWTRMGRKLPGEVAKVKTSRNETIILVLLRHSSNSRKTILMSHGTAVDVGRLIPWYKEVAEDLKVNLCVYDYSGYGRSTGSPSVSNTLADIEACYNWLLKNRFSPSDIVLYGQSIGSGPTANLAARNPKVAGVVLHAAFSGANMAGLGLFYPNLSHVSNIESPLLVVHGCKDKVFDVSEGKTLHSAAKRPGRPYWAPDAGHEDVETSSQYVTHLKTFFVDIWGHGYV